jgi:hypothetical protein
MSKLPSPWKRSLSSCLHLANLLPVIVVLFLASSTFLQAQPGPVVMSASSSAPANGVPANQVVTLSATMSYNGAPVTEGTVTFFLANVPNSSTIQASVILGTVPVNSSVASLNYLFPTGSYHIAARYNGSTQAGMNTASIPSFNVGGTAPFSLSSSGTSSGYTLTATMTSNGGTPPTGNITFLDASTNQTLGTAPLTNPTIQSTAKIAPPLGDFNGDGRIDTVMLPGGGIQLTVNLANVDGTTTPVTSDPFYPADDGYALLAVGDFNNDGNSDLVVQDMNSQKLTVLLSQGNGQFSIAGQETIPVATSTVVGDFNNDGNLDLLISSTGGTDFYAGDGKGGLSTGETLSTSVPGAALVGDYNNDGHLDFFSFTPNSTYGFAGTSLYLGAGDGTTFTQQSQNIFGGGSYPPPGNVNAMVTGSFCASRNADIAYADYSSVTVLCGDGSGNFIAPSGGGQFVYGIGTHSVVKLTAADVNADAREDIVVFAQDTADPQAPWNMIVLTGSQAGFSVSAEAASDSSGTNFTNVPVPLLVPVVGESLTTLSPIGNSLPFASTSTVASSVATITNVQLSPGTQNVTARTDNFGFTNTIQLAGNSAGYPGPILANLTSSNGSATTNNGVLQLTDGGLFEAGSAFSPDRVYVGAFASTFTFQLTNAQADGFTFTLQDASPQALGSSGGMLGYAGIAHSVALKFDLYDNAGEGINSIGIYTNGASPTVPATDLTGSGIDLHSGHVMKAQLVYDSANLHVNLTDMSTQATFSQTYPVNIISATGSSTAYVGFTGATGGLGATQQILSWTYAPLPAYGFSGGSAGGSAFNGEPTILLNGGATIATPRGSPAYLDFLDNTPNEARSAWFPNPVPITQFTNDFSFVASGAADGITFTIQNAGASALGPSGGGLGYGPDTPGEPVGIPNSMAIKFDLFDNQGEGINSTGIFTAGDSPTVPAIDLTPTGIDLHSGHNINVHMVYDGSTITMTLLDITTKATWTHYFYGVDLPALVGGPTAFIGFTGGTGGLATYGVLWGWTYLPSNTITSPLKTSYF